MRSDYLKSLLLICLVLLSYGYGYAIDGVQVNNFPNELKLLTYEDHTSPLVAITIAYHTGVKNEPVGKSGITHLCTWFINDGTPNFRGSEYSRIVQSEGGRFSYKQIEDVIYFTVSAPASMLDTILYLEADRMRNIDFTYEKLLLARDAARKKRLVDVESSIYGHINEEFTNLAYRSHPYGNPSIGWPDDIKSIDLDDVKNYFRTYFSPANATISIAGDFSTEEVVARVGELFGSIISGPTPGYPNIIEPEQIGSRYSYLIGDAGIPVVLIGFHGPSLTDDDYAVIQVISMIMAGGESARLQRRMVNEDRSAFVCGSGYLVTEDPGLVYFWSVLNHDSDVKQGESEINEELEHLKTEPVTDRELEMAKNRIEAQFYRDNNALSDISASLGLYQVMTGDWKSVNSIVDNTRNVTKEDIIRVANKYFEAKNRTVVFLEPPGRPGIDIEEELE